MINDGYDVTVASELRCSIVQSFSYQTLINSIWKWFATYVAETDVTKPAKNSNHTNAYIWIRNHE